MKQTKRRVLIILALGLALGLTVSVSTLAALRAAPYSYDKTFALDFTEADAWEILFHNSGFPFRNNRVTIVYEDSKYKESDLPFSCAAYVWLFADTDEDGTYETTWNTGVIMLGETRSMELSETERMDYRLVIANGSDGVTSGSFSIDVMYQQN